MKNMFSNSEELIAIAFGGSSSSSSSSSSYYTPVSSSTSSGVRNPTACKSDVDSAMALGATLYGAVGVAAGGIGSVVGVMSGAAGGMYSAVKYSANCQPKK